MNRAILSLLVLSLFPVALEAQSCQPSPLPWSRSATATRVLLAGNAAQRSASSIAQAMSQAMNTWNASPCQQGGIRYPWFQSQASGAEHAVKVYFDQGLAVNIDGACGEMSNNEEPLPTIHLYTHFKDSHGVVHSCDSVDLGLQLSHELGHYLGLHHTSADAACSGHLMYPALTGDESLKPEECQAADRHNETGWEAGEVGCTDDDWCDPDHCSPILIDFAGDLFQLSGAEESPVWFDIDGTGRKRPIGWTIAGTDDGFLCRDLNRNGRIDGGHELFGTATRLSNGDLAKSGYEAMGELDLASLGGNGDGVLSGEDRGFWGLCVWRDVNRNGISESSELVGLPWSGVVSLELSNVRSPHLDAHSNVLMYHSGGQVLRDGESSYVRTVDVFFASSSSRHRP